MSFLLDTNICIAFLNDNDRKVRQRLLALDPSEVSLCSVVKAELLCGARHSQKVDDNLQRLATFFAQFSSLTFNDVAAEHYAVIREQLARTGRLIGANDMLIAAIALGNDNVLVTRNANEFLRVAGLRMERW